MSKRAVNIVALSLATLMALFVVWQICNRTTLCDYSRFRSQANACALAHDFSAAISAESKALRNLSDVQPDLRQRARAESLLRLAKLSLANGQIDQSIGFRNELIESWKQDKSRSYCRQVQRKLVDILENASQLEPSAQTSLFDGTAASFKADLHLQHERPYQAIECLNEAIKEFNSGLGEHNLPAALISGQLVQLQLRYGGAPDVSERIDEINCLLHCELGADHPQTIELLKATATISEVWAKWPRYVETYETYLDKLGEIDPYNKRELVAAAKKDLALGYSRTGNIDKAISYYDESEGLVRDLYGETSIELVKWKFIRASNYLATGEWKKGELLLDTSLTDLETLLENFSGQWNEPTRNNLLRWKAETIHRYALCALYDEGLDKAHKIERGRKHFNEAKAILDELGLQKSLRYVYVLRQLCEVEHLAKRDLQDETTDEQRTKKYIDDACEIYRELYGNKLGPYYRLLLLHLISTERAWENYEESIEVFLEAVNLKLANPNKAQIAMCLRQAGLTYSDWGKPAQAIEAYANAIDMYGEFFFVDLLSSSESRADAYAEFSRDCLKDMVAAADKTDRAQVSILFEYLSRVKGMVARAQAARSQIGDQVDESVRAKLRQVGKDIFNLIVEKVKSSDSNPEIDAKIKQLTREKREIVAQIGNSIALENIQFESNIISRLQRLLPHDTTLVEFYLQPENQISEENIYYAFIFTNKKDDYDLRCVKLGNADDIDEIVTRFNQSARHVERNRDVFDVEATRLREITWDRIRQLWEKSKSTVICGDGQLSTIPWSGLPSSEIAGQYLAHEFAIITATNSRDLVENLSKPAADGEGSLLVGNLDFGPPVEPIAITRIAPFGCFPRLEESSRELESLEPRLRLVGDVYLLQNDDATLQSVITRLDSVRFAHFATHGFFLGSLDNGLAEHPFARSALALSGANQPIEPFEDPRFLSGEQIISINLSNIELVVLSACDSSRGFEFDGEGTLGIQRAMILAGVKTCVASRWPIGDVEARKFMELYYKNLFTKKLGKIDALRQAQIQMHKLGHPPESWANWKLLGDWR